MFYETVLFERTYALHASILKPLNYNHIIGKDDSSDFSWRRKDTINTTSFLSLEANNLNVCTFHEKDVVKKHSKASFPRYWEQRS